MFLGIAWSVFQVLSAIRINGASLIDWTGALTPGGETVDDVRLNTAFPMSGGDAGGDRAQ